MNTSYNPDQHYSSWMSPSEARRTEFAALTVEMADCLDNLQRCLDENDGHQQTNSTYQYTPSVNYGLHAPLSTCSSSYSNDYSSQSLLASSPGLSHTDFNRTYNQYIPTHNSNSPQDMDYNYSSPPPPSGIRVDRSVPTAESPSTRITNQRRADSINRGGSQRREAPADKVCGFCQASFTRNERLRYHIESVHLQLEPEYGCDVPGCQRAFRQRSDLLRHQRTVHRTLFGK
ncbi:hypothetical protein MJO29_010551 [Puccinia striiformis f. sp. tritici]|uniref:C2H2-type domain-containing protein n=3 Tax=Puccinia striiformis TaxID=27350 RepID=A0A0L0W1I8_9BASI|nr:hypothetical protein Pst134EA_019621 [Puccinia striiformis f. sp. tritici]KAI9618647.1 hypothetical protein KEM48_006626 [Puccinia striiformis f. sp. tritici PST-130]KNF05376.1 hypothetical protein PSTG_01589 [Puccinia striiformis f. sp. tritici PST-78]POW04192.1 hypothetical protein PSHT_11391 [Puccinia striiformis]KAH9449715.1 hypothetical protein Pst134EB_020530 [Puccinia striiformis f. sp. tritici]KAH9459468.1 hypothetical protein Pst134EA_019621 [Puccinia striiformis f. sp. tritici]